MAIHTEVAREGAEGILKQFEMSAAPLLFDNLQKNQYQFPAKSTIRELVSNARDAINEKIIALQVLDGQAKSDEFYLTRDEPIYVDSNYMPEYYDARWLDRTDNITRIIYEEAPGAGRDTLRIIDNGVGVGHIVNPKTRQSRLQGILKLGYSTKRNSSQQLGKFGIGAKSALSTGIDSYTMITRHNGMEFKFEIYDYKADPLIPRMNMMTGKENPHVIFEDWEKRKTDDGSEVWSHVGNHTVYYLPTTEKNGTELIVPAKRHNRATYISAVKDQLLYFDNVEMIVVHEDGEEEEVDFRAEIHYEDDYIILSDNNQFSKPHFVLNGVNYGYINFQELELEERLGNIGYKIKPESVTVNPSRESLVWDDRTRATVLAMQQKVADIASEIVTKEMVEEDLLKWIRKCTQALGDNYDKTTVIGRLSNLVDKTQLKPIFKPYPTIVYKKEPKDFFHGMEILSVSWHNAKKRDGSGFYNKIHRENLRSWTGINKTIYLQTGETSYKREQVMMGLHPEGFIKLKVKDVRISFQEGDEMTAEEVIEFQKLKEDTAYFGEWEKKQQIFYKFIKDSSEIRIYEDIEIPAALKDKPEKEDDEEDGKAAIGKMTPAERRAIEGKTICAYPYYQEYYGSTANFGWAKSEPTFREVLLDTADIVYGFKEDEELIHMLANMLSKGQELSDRNEKIREFYNKDFKLVRIAQSAAKHFRRHTYIKDFILSINPETRTIAMHNKLVNWHTGRKIDDALTRMKFLENFRLFNPEIAEAYFKLKTFRDLNYKTVDGSTKFGCNEEMLTDLNTYSDKVIQLQMYIESHPGDAVAIAAQAKALFDLEEDDETFEGAVGVNLEVFKSLQTVLEYIEPMEVLFNYIEPLTASHYTITPELEHEIKEIMRYKGILK